jgi:tol-pal system protein YbgF
MTNTRRLSLALGTALTSTFLLIAAAPLTISSNDGAPSQRYHGLQLAGIFGESDEERAARLAREQKEADQDAAIANLNTQVRDLQDTVRRLTGQNETLTHRVQEQDIRIDRMQKDFEYKLCTVTAQQVGGSSESIPCGADNGNAGASYTPPPQQQQPSQSFALVPPSNAPRSLAPPPGVIGTLPRNAAMPQQSGSAGAPAPSDADAAAASPYRAEFDTGLNLLGKAQYDEARAAFRAYADSHPKDDLAPQAVFWVANIAYVQKDYPNAARAFAEEIKKYPSNSRAPESMFKLGQSLIAMGKTKEGCFTLGSIPGTYPKAPKATLAQAAAARKVAACK